MTDRVRVVVIDDSVDTADALVAALVVDGYDAVAVYDARQALAVVEQHRPLCVLLDIAMPVIDGIELSRQLRKTCGDALVLIAITGQGDPAERVSTAFANFDHYLRKPIDFDKLAKFLPPLKP